jgi:hypothetical protein
MSGFTEMKNPGVTAGYVPFRNHCKINYPRIRIVDFNSRFPPAIFSSPLQHHAGHNTWK